MNISDPKLLLKVKIAADFGEPALPLTAVYIYRCTNLSLNKIGGKRRINDRDGDDDRCLLFTFQALKIDYHHVLKRQYHSTCDWWIFKSKKREMKKYTFYSQHAYSGCNFFFSLAIVPVRKKSNIIANVLNGSVKTDKNSNDTDKSIRR